MDSNDNNENMNSNINLKTDVYSTINDNSFTKTNPTKCKSSEYVSTNIKGEKDKLEKQKLILNSSSDLLVQ